MVFTFTYIYLYVGTCRDEFDRFMEQSTIKKPPGTTQCQYNFSISKKSLSLKINKLVNNYRKTLGDYSPVQLLAPESLQWFRQEGLHDSGLSNVLLIGQRHRLVKSD